MGHTIIITQVCRQAGGRQCSGAGNTSSRSHIHHQVVGGGVCKKAWSAPGLLTSVRDAEKMAKQSFAIVHARNGEWGIAGGAGLNKIGKAWSQGNTQAVGGRQAGAVQAGRTRNNTRKTVFQQCSRRVQRCGVKGEGRVRSGAVQCAVVCPGSAAWDSRWLSCR